MDHPAAAPHDSVLTRGGLVPGGEGQAAFELVQPRRPRIPVLIAVPHAGRCYPPDLLAAMRHPGESCLRLEDRLADLLAREVAAASGASLLVAHAPRAMIDLNRAPDDMDWEMVAGPATRSAPRLAAGRRARSGLGLVPRRLQGIGEVWRGQMRAADLAARIDLVHRPYHLALAAALEDLRDRWGAALLIDLHSMPPLGPKTGWEPAADFVIGDRFGASCGAALSLAASAHLAGAGWQAAHNRPYAGGYVLDRHGAPQRNCHAMQIEVCRAIYLDSALREPGAGIARVVQTLKGLVARLAAELGAGSSAFAQAAE